MLVELSINPLGRGTHLSKDLGEILKIIDDSKLPYCLTPSGTCIEGDWEEVFGTIRKCWEALEQDCDRVQLIIKADWRRGAAGRLLSKIAAVEEKLGHKVKT